MDTADRHTGYKTAHSLCSKRLIVCDSKLILSAKADIVCAVPTEEMAHHFDSWLDAIDVPCDIRDSAALPPQHQGAGQVRGPARVRLHQLALPGEHLGKHLRVESETFWTQEQY
jgi:hypothetical protein